MTARSPTRRGSPSVQSSGSGGRSPPRLTTRSSRALPSTRGTSSLGRSRILATARNSSRSRRVTWSSSTAFRASAVRNPRWAAATWSGLRPYSPASSAKADPSSIVSTPSSSTSTSRCRYAADPRGAPSTTACSSEYSLSVDTNAGPSVSDGLRRGMATITGPDPLVGGVDDGPAGHCTWIACSGSCRCSSNGGGGLPTSRYQRSRSVAARASSSAT